VAKATQAPATRVVSCAICGLAFEARDRGKATKQVCSTRCRNVRNKRQRDPEGLKADRRRARRTVERVCQWCGVSFTARVGSRDPNAGRVYCSAKCHGAAKGERYGSLANEERVRRSPLDPTSPIRVRECSGGCGVLRTLHGSCTSWKCDACSAPVSFVMGHCQRCGLPYVGRWFGTSSSPYCSETCSQAAASKRQVLKYGWNASAWRKRCRVMGLEYEVIHRASVYERDGWRCGLCGKAVSRDIRGRRRGAPSLDHIIPLSRGGSHTYANVQLAHFECNAAKGNRGQQQLSLFR
jgi:hypothetical protein